MMNMQSAVTILPTIVTTELHGSITIFNPSTDRYYTLDGAGAAIWQSLERTSNLQEVQRELLARYETTEETSERDLLALIAQFEAAGLVEVRTS